MCMKVSCIAALLCLVWTAPLLGQQIQVLDQDNYSPIEDVFIYNEAQDHWVNTGPDGKALVDVFAGTDTFYLQHPAYEGKTVARATLAQNNYRVFLKEQVIQIQEKVRFLIH